MWKSQHSVRPRILVLSFFIVLLTLLSAASAQDFTLVASPVSPAAVFPGGQNATASINVSALNSMNPVNVDLTCQVTPVQTTGTPTCVISPASVTTPANPSLTITTSSTTPSTLYTVTVTGTDSSGTLPVAVNVTVLSAVPEYTVTITTALTPTSVHAGSTATAVLSVTPINGYTGTVTLSCSTITPTATPAPTCAFSPASVALTTAAAQTSTLTISTTGAKAAAISHSNFFYGLWLPISGLALIALGFGTVEKRRNRVLGLSLLCIIAAGVLLPACNTSSTSSTSTTATPKNGYSFTISATDAHSLAPSNGTQTVSLTVN